MRTRLIAVLALLLVLPAALQAQGEAKPAAIDPAGKYAVSTMVQGQPADFEMIVEKKDDGSYGGTMSNPNYGTSVITSLTVEGRTMKIVLATAQGTSAALELTLNEDNTIDGSWSMEGDGGKLTGKKNS